MKYIAIILLFIFSCSSGKRNHIEEKVKTRMSVTSYTGNAVAFFSKESRYHMIFIPIQEQDSNVFKDKNFDVYKVIKGRCAIKVWINNYWLELVESKKQKIVSRNICNIQDCNRYLKVWISYKDYVEGPYRKLKNPIIDSCALRCIGLDKYEKSHMMKINILDNK